MSPKDSMSHKRSRTLAQLATSVLWLALICISVVPVYSQGTITGVVVENGTPLEFANVFITPFDDSLKITNGAVSDSLGRFRLENIPWQKYHLNIKMVGFITRQVEVAIDPQHQKIDLGMLALNSDATLLNAVEVRALRDIIKKTDEGFVINASDNLTQIGGTASDLLRNMPGVLVDADGGLTIRGKSPLTLINGRVSGIAGADRSAQLDRIPASAIERIEIINNPSARYDADAEGGIINIILKKNREGGTNGAFAIGMGHGDRYRINGSALVNHRTNKWNLGAAYDNWYTTRTRKVTGDRTNYDLPDQYFLIQRRRDERLIFYQNAKATVDFTPNQKNTFNLEALWAFPGEDNHETLNNTFRKEDDSFNGKNQRYSNEIRRTQTVELALNYAKRFDDPDKRLNVTVTNAYGNDKENTGISTIDLTEQDVLIGTSSLQRTHTYQKTDLGSVAVDYSQSTGSNSSIETGYKGIMRNLNASYERSTLQNENYVIDPLNTNVFDFNEQIHAVYAQWNGWAGEKNAPRVRYNIGLRAEQVWNKGKTINETDKFTNQYFNLYPSVNLYYSRSERDNLKFSYGRRINRPGLGQLNPFVDITDSLNQHSGNSHLKPELVHAFELGYTHATSRTSVSVSGFYRIRNHAMLQYTVLDDNGVALTRPVNLGHALTYGVEALVSQNLASFWSMNFSLSAFETQIKDSGDVGDVSSDQFSWYAKWINNFAIKKNTRIQVIGNYVSPVATPQGRSIEIYNIDIGFQQTIIKGSGRIGVVVTDIFNTQRSGLYTSDYNFNFYRTVKLDTRAVMLTFGYTFNSSFKDKLMENRFKND